MALKGSYNFKGISLADAYVKIVSVNHNTDENVNNVIKTAAVYNSDGSLKTEAVYHDVVVKSNSANYQAKIWKDKALRDTAGKFYENIAQVSGNFVMDVSSSAKNPVVQAYTAMKAEDAWKDYADV
jgi:hypothetical protein|tara:strand:+ start:855 stop:1232 length:378 start_codon:yes stop_codon:yes gene_type:complete